VKEATLHREIVKVAQDLFEMSGRVEGHDLDNWLEAERIVVARHKVKEKLDPEIFSKKNDISNKGSSRRY
jgi:hypothetical protein